MPSASSRSSSASITSAGEICNAPGASARVSTPDSRHAATVRAGSDGSSATVAGASCTARQDARRADLADQGVRGERRQRVGELRLELPSSLAEALALHDVQVGERGGGRRRVARIGVAVPPDAGALRPERFGDPRSRDRGAHRQVAARDALRARDDVGFELPAPAREPLAAAAEARDDLVGDEQHAGLAAHGAGGRQVAVGGGIHAARADHRLAEERGHLVGADLLDHRAEVVGVVPSDLHHVLDQLSVAGRVRRDAGQAGARGVHAVVRALAADQDRSLGLSYQLPEPPRHLRRGVDRVGAAAREEHAAVGDGREGRHPLGELRGRAVREVAERRVGGERGHLGGGRVGDVLAAAADVRRTRGPRSHRGSAVPTRPRPERRRRGPGPARRARTPTPCRRTDARSGPCGRGYQRYPRRPCGRNVGTRTLAQSVSYARFGRSQRSASAMLSPRRRA